MRRSESCKYLSLRFLIKTKIFSYIYDYRKLVERLENMKRNASRAGCPSPNRCALCGDYFCLLRSVPNQCGFCHKILCTKCCIDTQYTVDDDSTGGSMQSRRNSTSNISMSSTKVVVYLCRLCSEQREVNIYFRFKNKFIYLKFFCFQVFKKIRSLVS